MNNTKHQHVVPQFHLRYFSENNTLAAVRISDGYEFKTSVYDACGWDWIYDDDPQATDSLENILRKDEKDMSVFMNNIVKNDVNVANADDLIKYVCLLSSRSLDIIESVQHMMSNGIIDSNTKNAIKQYYLNRRHLLNGNNRSLFDAFILKSNSTIDFITADVPYYLQDVRGSENEDRLSIGNDYFNSDYVAWFCPISLKQCIVITRKTIIGGKIQSLIKDNNNDELIRSINMNMAYYATEFIYSKKTPINAYRDSKELDTHSLKLEYLDNIMKIRKNHKLSHS